MKPFINKTAKIGDLLTINGNNYRVIGVNQDVDANNNPVDYTLLYNYAFADPLNTSSSLTEGWPNTTARLSSLEAKANSLLPSFIIDRIIPVKKYTTTKNNLNYITYDKYFTLSVRELNLSYTNTETLGVIYNYFANNSIRAQIPCRTTRKLIWTRTAIYNRYSNYFMMIENGVLTYTNGNNVPKNDCDILLAFAFNI